jgi:hypothetical protein
MGIKTERELSGIINERYDIDPKDWHIRIFRNLRGYYDIVVLSPDETWHISTDSIYKGSHQGFGGEIKLSKTARKSLIGNNISSGFRGMKRKTVENTLKDLHDQGFCFEHAMETLFAKILVGEVISSQDFRQMSAGTIGPTFYSRGPLEYLSPSQRELCAKLDREMRKLQSRRPYI